MKRRNFIAGCLCCTCMAALGGGFFYKKQKCFINQNKNNELIPNPDFIKHIEIHLTEHCNLNCKYCSHFSCIAKEEYYDVEKYEKDIKRLSEITNGNILHIQLLGGEPLLHPRVTEFFDITRKYFPKYDVNILTNGLLLSSMKDEFWKKLKDNNIDLILSVYPIKLNWNQIFSKAKKYGIKIYTEAVNGNIELTPENIEKYKVKKFYKVSLDLSGNQSEERYCISKVNCTNLIDGKIYPCFLMSNIRHFNSFFNKNIKITNDDYIDIYKAKSAKEINQFLVKSHHFCKYCKIEGERPWENSKTHTIDEWIS